MDRAIQWIGKSLRSTVNILEVFDKYTGVAAQHGHHPFGQVQKIGKN